MAGENKEEVVDDFAAAFAEAVQGVADPDKDVAEAAAAIEMGTTEDKPAEDKPAEDKPAEDKPVEDKPAEDKPAEDKPAEDRPPEDRPAEDKPAEDRPPEDRPADDRPVEDVHTEDEPAEIQSVEDQFPDPELSEDDIKALDAFTKNWDEIAPAVDIKVNHVTAALEAKVARTLAKIVGNIYADFAPVIQSHVKAEASSFRGAVLKAHDDYDKVYPQLESWIKTHPAYLQFGLLKAYNEGTAEEVIDLVGRYKQANGVKPQASAPAVIANDEPVKTPSATAAALAPVSTKRTTPKPSGADPEDYDSAFDEAAAGFSK